MSSSLSIQSPYLVAALPKPVDSVYGKYYAGDVFNGLTGSKKRKRPEIAVGIDGESVNIYAIQQPRLITSHALPPQSSFTCAPYSLRKKRTGSKTAERSTYVSIREDENAKVTVFHESVTGDEITQRKPAERKLETSKHSIVYMAPVTPEPSSKSAKPDVLLVRKDGQIQCLEGEELASRWTSRPSALQHEPAGSAFEVEFAQLTNVAEAKKGLLKHRGDIVSTVPGHTELDGSDIELLVLVTKSAKGHSTESRTVHILALPNVLFKTMQTLGSFKLPLPAGVTNTVVSNPTYKLQPATGTLHALRDGSITTYDLTSSVPKSLSTLPVQGTESFLRLSNNSIMTSDGSSISVFNPAFRSIQAKASVAAALNEVSFERRRKSGNAITAKAFHLVAFFPKLETVLAIGGSSLYGVQIESQASIRGKQSSSGLLIDSIGRGIGLSSDVKQLNESRSTTLAAYMPGSAGSLRATAPDLVKRLDAYAEDEHVEAFEAALAEHLGDAMAVVGLAKHFDIIASLVSPGEVDPALISYTLSKVFHWSEAESKLSIKFVLPNFLQWLVNDGYLTTQKIESALRHDPSSSNVFLSIPAGQLVQVIVEADPEMNILVDLLSFCPLDAPELVHAIRNLMRSLELFGNSLEAQALLANGEIPSEAGDIEASFALETDQAEAALQLAEHRLNDSSNIRAQALSLALTKLYKCPSRAIVQALQSTFSTPEIMALIYLLRFELARGSWTSRYLEPTNHVIEDEESGSSDNGIILLSSMLNSCIDAIGAGGWLSGSAPLSNSDRFESEELIASLKLEVSAALEGIEEACYLKNLIGEMVRYGERYQANRARFESPGQVEGVIDRAAEREEVKVERKKRAGARKDKKASKADNTPEKEDEASAKDQPQSANESAVSDAAAATPQKMPSTPSKRPAEADPEEDEQPSAKKTKRGDRPPSAKKARREARKKTEKTVGEARKVDKAAEFPKPQKPMARAVLDPEANLLPYAMKVEVKWDTVKKGMDGEERERSVRDMAYLRSQQVGKYSREKIVV